MHFGGRLSNEYGTYTHISPCSGQPRGHESAQGAAPLSERFGGGVQRTPTPKHYERGTPAEKIQAPEPYTPKQVNLAGTRKQRL